MSKPRAVQFERSVPVLGTGRLQESFDVDAHWNISTSHLGGEPWVMLSRDAVPEKNVPAVKAFVVRGVGFVESLEDVRNDEAGKTQAKGDEGGKQAPVDAGAGSKDSNDSPSGSPGAGSAGPRGRGPRKVKP